ncbi:hypothetical protein LINGRAHAP2_LOCUS30323 [Linum grandiflorum]
MSPSSAAATLQIRRLVLTFHRSPMMGHYSFNQRKFLIHAGLVVALSSWKSS